MNEPNVNISGDEARLLLSLMQQMEIIKLYIKLTEIHIAQPK